MADSGATSTAQKVVFKKSGRSAQMYARRRNGPKQQSSSEGSLSNSSCDETGGGGSKSSVRRKGKRENPMVQSTSRAKAMRKAGHASSSASSSDDGEEAERQRAMDIDLQYQSKKETGRMGPSDQGATATNEQDTDFKVDAQAQFERVQKQLKEQREKGEKGGEEQKNLYHGMALYGAKEKKDTAQGSAASGFNRKGPIRAPQFVRQSVRWDYAADICKDFKETGFCTFGDTCKFMHDRTDYKFGWELEREHLAGRMQEDAADKYAVSSDSDDDDLPTKCFICRNTFVDPVVTKCKHYFCEKCALDEYRRGQKCYICDRNTGGVFNPAKEVAAKLKAVKEANGKPKKKRDDGDSDESEEHSDGGDGGKKEQQSIERTAPSADGGECDNDTGLVEDTPIELLPDDGDRKDPSTSDEGSDVGAMADDSEYNDNRR